MALQAFSASSRASPSEKNGIHAANRKERNGSQWQGTAERRAGGRGDSHDGGNLWHPFRRVLRLTLTGLRHLRNMPPSSSQAGHNRLRFEVEIDELVN